MKAGGAVPVVAKRFALVLVMVGGLALVWSVMLPVPSFLDVTRWRVSSKVLENELVQSHQIYAEAEWGGDPSTYSVSVQLLDGQRMTFWRVSPESFDSPEFLLLRSIDDHALGCEQGGRNFVTMGVLSKNNSATSRLGIENMGDAVEKAAELRDAMLSLGSGTGIRYRGEFIECYAAPSGES